MLNNPKSQAVTSQEDFLLLEKLLEGLDFSSEKTRFEDIIFGTRVLTFQS